MPRVPATPNLGGVSTRMLIILALVCGLAVLVGNRGGSRARHRLPDIPSVHAWLGVHP